MTATTANIRGRINTSAGGQLTATSDVTPTFRFRTLPDNASQFRTAALILTGTWVGTVSLQVSAPDMDVWADAQAFTATGVTSVELPGSLDFRVIFTSRTSGTVNAWLSP